jgi:non-specific serine/threonine protein kinase
LVETCANLADHLLRNCPNLKMISSSREALGVAGEAVYRVPPLALPDADSTALASLHRSEAIQLFIERAAGVRPGFGLNEANAPAVAQICRRLDGIPLALELAAARVGMLTPQQIATRLDDRFRLLTGGSRTALPRQQTLRSLIDWSYDLLSEPERLLFCQLAVFVGGWSLEAAEAVCPDADVLELLSQLIKKSLVVAEEREDLATTRFHLLETIRQYARDRLLELEANTQVRDRHLDYYLKFAEAGESNSFGPQRMEWLYTCELEHDNFRAALQWALEYNVEAAMRLCGALATFWGVRGFIIEGRSWVKAALDRAAGLSEPQGEEASRQRHAALAKGLLASSQMSYGDGDYQAGLRDSQAAVQIYRQLGNPFALAFALCHLGSMAAYQSDLDLAEGALTEAIGLARQMGDKVNLCYGLGVLSNNVMLPRGDVEAARTYAEESIRCAYEIGMEWGAAQGELILARIAMFLGEWDAARQHALTAAAVFQATGDPLVLHIAYIELGDTELCAGNLPEAERYHQQCILAFQQFSNRAFIAHGLESFAFIARARNQPARAARLLGAAEGLREGMGISVFGVERLENEYNKTIAWLHTLFDETTYRAHWDKGCDMGMEQAISYALEPI